jgi:TNF receptor-associated factor 4
MACKYMGIGCTKELKRKDMAAHEQDDSPHLHMALDTVSSLQVKSITLKSGGFFSFSVSKYEGKKKAKERFNSPSFYTSPNGYHMTVSVDVNGDGNGKGTHVSVFARILEGKYDAGLKWPFIGDVKVVLLNQLEDKNHHIVTIDFTTADNRHALSLALGYRKFISHSALAHDPVKNTQYLKDDTLYFRVSVEVAEDKPWLQHQQFSS